MKRERLLFSMFLIVFAVVVCIVMAVRSEDVMYDDVWVLCQPDSYVNIRVRPSGRSETCGFKECGESVTTDGVKKNGFLHVFPPNELGEGWISLGYIVTDRPVPVMEKRHITSRGRVNARKTINGNRRMWLYDDDELKVYWMSDTWAVTNKGFVKSKFIAEW